MRMGSGIQVSRAACRGTHLHIPQQPKVSISDVVSSKTTPEISEVEKEALYQMYKACDRDEARKSRIPSIGVEGKP